MALPPVPMSLLALALLVGVTSSVRAEEAVFYVGSFTKGAAGQGISVGRLDTSTGRLAPLVLAAEAVDPNFLALAPDGKSLYAVTGEAGGSVAAFRVGDRGQLDALNSLPSGGGDPCHVGVDPSGRNVFAANYGGGSIVGFRAKPDGSLDERVAFEQFTGSGPDPKRQKGPRAHSVDTDPSGRFLYACDLGTDLVRAFHLDPATGALISAPELSAKVAPGAGPRHLAFHPGGRQVYVTDEMGLTLTVLARDASTGALTPGQVISTQLPGAPVAGVSTAEIHCHPGGRWLYVSNRGADTIAVFEIAHDGGLTLLETPPAGVKTPRGFAIDPTGAWMVVAGQGDNRIAVHRIDPQTGRLTPTDQSAEVPGPTCVLFAPTGMGFDKK